MDAHGIQQRIEQRTSGGGGKQHVLHDFAHRLTGFFAPQFRAGRIRHGDAGRGQHGQRNTWK